MTTSLIPTSLTQLSDALRHLTPNSLILGGGTDLIIRMREKNLQPDVLLSLSDVPELRRLTITPHEVYIGAMVTMHQAEFAFDGLPDLQAIAHAAGDVGSPQIRNKGTIGGNVANASPAGDLPPVLWMLDAQVEILGVDNACRSIPIRQFITGVSKTELQPQEVVIGFTICRRQLQGFRTAFHKLGHRSQVTISRIGMAMALKQDSQGIIEEARVIAGAIQTKPFQLVEAEKLLIGRRPTPDFAVPIGETFQGNTRRVYKAAAAKGVAEDVLLKLI